MLWLGIVIGVAGTVLFAVAVSFWEAMDDAWVDKMDDDARGPM